MAPFGGLLRDFDLSPREADLLLAKLGGWWVQWTSSADESARARGWHAVICRAFIPTTEIPSANTRSKLRRGLKRCRVLRVSIDDFLAHAFDIHDAAVRNYARPATGPIDRAAFVAATEPERDFEDLCHYWLATIDGTPVAYARTILHDRSEVDYSAFKFDPEHLKHYPSYALIHEMNRHYLEEAGYGTVSVGQRSVHHDTEFQAFLIRELGFVAHPLLLRIRFARGIGLGVRLARLARGPISRASRNAGALLALDGFAEEV